MRRAFTLIELLAVIVIMGILASMAVLIWPHRETEIETVTALQGLLAEAKSRALRDGRPCGVRVNTNSFCAIEQPDEWVNGKAVDFSCDGTTVTAIGDFSGLDFVSGDMIEFGNDITVLNSYSANAVSGPLQNGSQVTYWNAVGQRNWRIVRLPRLSVGYIPILVPENVNITLDTISNDVVFSPGGSLVGRSSPARFIVGKYVVQVNAGTGMIQVAPVAPGSDPFAFCRDGRSSGF